MRHALEGLTIRGFKSIEELEGMRLDNLEVLIGANGAGKSNFVEFFGFMRAVAEESLQAYLNAQGGGDGFLYLGPKVTPRIEVRLLFGDLVYELDLAPTAKGGLQVALEQLHDRASDRTERIGRGSLESGLKRAREKAADDKAPAALIHDALSGWMVYHFHDTSALAPMRREQSARDRDRLRDDASNIAAFLLHLKQKYPEYYALIRDSVRLIAPFFDDFLLRPEERGFEEKIRLEWTQKGSDFPFQPVHLSDGTFRFICLATALQQPQLPRTIVIDEPELGLHPFALGIVADLIKTASERTQVIISTQSPTLLDYFDPRDVVVVNRRDGRSTFDKLDEQALKSWLDEYTVGELWQKNVVEGGPAHE